MTDVPHSDSSSTLALMRFVKAHGSDRVQAQLRDWIRRDSELTAEVAALRAERDHYFAKMESVNLQRQRNEVRAIEAEAERDAWRDRHNEKAQLVERFLKQRDAQQEATDA